MVWKELLFAAILLLLTQATNAEVECEMEVQVPCDNITCLCQNGTSDKCETTTRVLCSNTDVCGLQGCGCSGCWKGDLCDIPNNPSTPVFDESSYSVDLEVYSEFVPLDFKVSDPDADLCEDVESPFCQCRQIRYRLADQHGGLFAIDVTSGQLRFRPVKGQKIKSSYELTLIAYNPMENAPQESKVTVTAHVLDFNLKDDLEKSLSGYKNTEKRDDVPEEDKPKEPTSMLSNLKNTLKETMEGAVGTILGRTEEERNEVKEEETASTSTQEKDDETKMKEKASGDKTVDVGEVSPTLKKFNTERKGSGSRQVPMMMMSGDTIQPAHIRKKRGTLGTGVPDEWAFTLEALTPFEGASPTYTVGDVIPYKLSIHASNVPSDVKIEMFSELAGGAYFMITNVRYGAVGSNFIGFEGLSSSVISNVRYSSVFNDGRHDYASVDLGEVTNHATDVDIETESIIEILFDALALHHLGATPTESYRVSVGITYMSDSYVAVAQDYLTYSDFTTNDNTVDATFSVTGPETLDIGVTGVWTVTMAVHDLFSDLALDVLAPIFAPGILRIDSISVSSVGSHYQHTSISDDGTNVTRFTYDNYGDYARMDFGEIINTGYSTNDPNNDIALNTIEVEVAITAVDDPSVQHNMTDPYKIGFTVWRSDMQSLEIIWSAQQTANISEVTANDTTLASSPSFVLFTSTPEATVDQDFAVLLNMTVPANSVSNYQLEVSMPVNSSLAMMSVNDLRLSRVGHNLPHLSYSVDPNAINLTSIYDGVNNDFASWDLGLISNTAQRTEDDDSTVQFEIRASVLSNCAQYYDDGDEITIAVGMRHGNVYYWVGRTSMIVRHTTNNYTQEQVPSFTLTSVMGSEPKIYADSAVVFDLDMFIPAGTYWAPVQYDVMGALTDANGPLDLVEVKAAHIGSAIGYSMNASATKMIESGETDADGRPLYSQATIAFEKVVSYRDVDHDDEFRYSDSVIRFRVIAVATAERARNMVTNDTYWTEMTVELGDDYIYVARSGAVFSDEMPMPYAGNDWQPVINVALRKGFSYSAPVGLPVYFDISVAIPYGTASDATLSAAHFNTSLDLCQLKLVSRGDGIVPYTPADTTGPVRSLRPDGGIYEINQTLSQVTSWGYGIWHGEASDSYLTYQVVVQPNAAAEVGQSLRFSAVASFSDMLFVTEMPELTAVTGGYTGDAEPEIELFHTTRTDVINKGGSALYYLSLYVPPQTSNKYDLKFYAPWNATNYGKYEILEVHTISAGENVPCVRPDTMMVSVNSSMDNPSGIINMATVNIGYASNLAADGPTRDEANKLTFAVHVSVPADSEAMAGDVYPVAATVDINSNKVWVGYQEFTVADPTDVTNEELGTPDVQIRYDGPSANKGEFDVGEIKNYTALLGIPTGTSYTNFEFTVHAPNVNDEAYASISELTVKSYGVNLLSAREHYVEDSKNAVEQVYGQTVKFGFLLNSGLSNSSRLITEEEVETANLLELTFSVRLLDHIDIQDHDAFNLSSSVSYSDTTTDATDHTELDRQVTAIIYDNDNALFDWDVAITDMPEDTVFQDSEISFRIQLALSDDARRFPDDVKVNFRAPYFSELASAINFTSNNPGAFTAPTEITDTGLTFTFDKMRYYDDAEIKFTIVVDPNKALQPGLYFRYLSIPVDISYKRENKSDPNNFDEWFTDMKSVQFEIYVPECLESLGMYDERIADCQITASGSTSDRGPEMARFNNSVSSWESPDRGPPFYQNEYIQVDFPVRVKFTGLTIQPANDNDTSRITSFRIQYSREGIRWEKALDDELNYKLFTITWDSGVSPDDFLFVPFGNTTFVAQHIRLIPETNAEGTYSHRFRFDVHGCPYPFGSTMPTSYSCPSNSRRLAHADRQVLIDPNTQEIYACVLSEPGQLPFCSGTDDLGISWFKIDDNVLNVPFHDNATDSLYGYARNGHNYLRSDDHGHTWYNVEDVTYSEALTRTSDLTMAVDFPWDAANFTLFDVMPNTAYESGLKKADGNEIAYWGTGQWDGP